MSASTRRRSPGSTAKEISLIALRHIVLPINAIIFAVVILLAVFGEVREGIFLGSIVFLNILLGFGQDVRAWLLLERIQLLTTPTISLIGIDFSEQQVEFEGLKEGDRVNLKLGDQMPCDGVVESGKSLEVNEGIITGESGSFPRGDGSDILAGSVVTSGTGIVRIKTSFGESRMAKMARGLERYSANPSPIQRSIEKIIRSTVYVLLAASAFIVVRGVIEHETAIRIVEEIGALASVLVPQGLVVSTTLLFTYGAGHFFKRNVLLQEVNATEKFGRIKNLCMDKTGTLTENILTVERLLTPPAITENEAREIAALYARFSGDVSLSIRALGAYLAPAPERSILDILTFSAWRRYGGIAMAGQHDAVQGTVVLVGGMQQFLPHLKEQTERTWLSEHSKDAEQKGMHVLCVVRTPGILVPRTLDGSNLSIVGLFVLNNKLREGVRGAVDFFQSRGITIRVLSGDSQDTVRAIASAAGVKNTDAIITGAEMATWTTDDYTHDAKKYALYARIEPEQKEKIIDALKLDGFTAMIGDGANDALAVKKADLGIAIYDGAPATRQIAAVVLMRNSFVELPEGVRLADSMIENIEIFASIFLNQTFLQFMLFMILTLAGSAYPLTPMNATFMNYFTVGLPGILIFFWAINPAAGTVPANTSSFLSRVVPLPLALSFVQIAGVLSTYMIDRMYVPADSPAPILVVSIIALGFTFFAVSSEFFSRGLNRVRTSFMLLFGIVEVILLFFAFKIPFVLDFFSIAAPSHEGIVIALLISVACGIIQYGITRLYFEKGRAVFIRASH